jgi:hypothetical protein
MTELPEKNIVSRLAAVMAEVGAVRKGDKNTQQGFSFRGIDAVVNACSPALRKHEVVVVPELRKITHSTVEVGTKRTLMGHVAVEVAYTFYGPEGDWVTAVTPGEAMDSGDKATAKAMSVAFRTALLQALSLPTDEPDPDEHIYERAAAAPEHTTPHPNPPAEVTDLLREIGDLADLTAVPRGEVASRFAAANGGLHLTRATVAQLEPVRDELLARKQRMETDQADISGQAGGTE